MSPELISTLGLLICAAPTLVHAPEVIADRKFVPH